MSDDARAARRRILIVTNPGPDNDDSDDERLLYRQLYYPHRPHAPPEPPRSSPSESNSSPAKEEPPHDPHDPPARRGIIQTLKAPFKSHSRPVDSPPRRPRTPPSTGKTIIVVTTDSDWYVTVDISGAPNAAFIRERIFNKLNILEQDQSHFAVYQTEMGGYALGEPLTDERLFTCCRNKGDSKGSLKFFVTQVHAQPLQPQRPYSPIIPSLPPPALPSYSGPLRPKRRSRQESVSSANEQHILESTSGYEADLDNPDRDRSNYKP
ncbi:MAP kinase kinase kinase mkh1, partial [Termitomyces sp. T112]